MDAEALQTKLGLSPLRQDGGVFEKAGEVLIAHHKDDAEKRVFPDRLAQLLEEALAMGVALWVADEGILELVEDSDERRGAALSVPAMRRQHLFELLVHERPRVRAARRP